LGEVLFQVRVIGAARPSSDTGVQKALDEGALEGQEGDHRRRRVINATAEITDQSLPRSTEANTLRTYRERPRLDTSW
jgi:hypothetical protein